MNFVDEDGRFVMPSIDIPVDVMLPPDANFVARNFLINIQQLKLKSRASTPSTSPWMGGRRAAFLCRSSTFKRRPRLNSEPLLVRAPAPGQGAMLQASRACQQFVREKSLISSVPPCAATVDLLPYRDTC